MLKKAVQVGNSVIRFRAIPVTNFRSASLRALIMNLTDSMRAHNLVGMAAPQIGVGLRVFVTEVRKTIIRKDVKEFDNLRAFINPRIISFSKKSKQDYEGCGSVANGLLFGPVKRPVSLVVRALNERGEKFELKANGLLARIIQHELDHLNGVVFIDKVTDTRKLLGREEYKKLRS